MEKQETRYSDSYDHKIKQRLAPVAFLVIFSAIWGISRTVQAFEGNEQPTPVIRPVTPTATPDIPQIINQQNTAR